MNTGLAKEKRLYKLKDFLSLRQKHQAYEQFYDEILPCVVGMRKCDKEKNYKERMTKIATSTDEAFAILVLINSWDLWKQMANYENCKIPEGTERVKPKWTRENNSKSGRSKGWNDDAIKNFNEWSKKIKNDRISHKNVELTNDLPLLVSPLLRL